MCELNFSEGFVTIVRVIVIFNEIQRLIMSVWFMAEFSFKKVE